MNDVAEASPVTPPDAAGPVVSGFTARTLDRHSALDHIGKMLLTNSPNVTLVNAEAADLMKYINEVNERNPEVFRREQPSVSTTPIPNLGILDYATAGTKMDKAKAHLDEGLPGGQKRRCETAFCLMREGLEELAVWMRARGYEV